MKNVTILGSTGSIGRSTLEVVKNLDHKFNVVGLAAGRNVDLLINQINIFEPDIVSVDRSEDAEIIKNTFGNRSPHILNGQNGAEAVAIFEKNDIVVSAITGIMGLRPTFAAVEAGKRIALANKESMVVAGPLIQKAASLSGAEIIPVDSEHSGIFQCLSKESDQNIKKVILTASGGPFFRTPVEEMRRKTPEEALNHPRWKMGKKVTIDSATLMNKGLELLEARWLFGLQPEQLDVLVHPQSIVHSLVEFKDGSVLAQLSPTDMKIPIQYALTFPERDESILPSLDLSRIKSLEFYDVDTDKFSLIQLARIALSEEESFSIALNAANEVVVEAFLSKQVMFMDIFGIIYKVMEIHEKKKINALEDIFEVDRETREKTRNLLKLRN